jgi:hypothetical protein
MGKFLCLFDDRCKDGGMISGIIEPWGDLGSHLSMMANMVEWFPV